MAFALRGVSNPVVLVSSLLISALLFFVPSFLRSLGLFPFGEPVIAGLGTMYEATSAWERYHRVT